MFEKAKNILKYFNLFSYNNIMIILEIKLLHKHILLYCAIHIHKI